MKEEVYFTNYITTDSSYLSKWHFEFQYYLATLLSVPHKLKYQRSIFTVHSWIDGKDQGKDPVNKLRVDYGV